MTRRIANSSQIPTTMTTPLDDSRESLGDRMKRYEATTEQILPEDQPAIIRLDGHGFSKFTRGFDKPFDVRLHDAMRQTAEDLLAYFPAASLAYTQSDEITLVFTATAAARPFSGRVGKLSTLAAGYASTRFNHHLSKAANIPDKKLGVAHFDARAFSVPTTAEVLNNLIWRAKFDCRRNSISAFGRSFFSTKEMHGLSANEIVEKLSADKGVDYWKSAPAWACYGTTVKREQFEFAGIDGKTGAEVKTTRSRMRSEEMKWWEFNEGNLALVTQKFWEFDSAAATEPDRA
ncbi:tRNAHis guanylyltransferase-domain-containing protein [Mycena vitilis]|nr:tRNAHis guanylyltransferase-domain-containing protein [Mycena vitilis]